MYALCFTWFWFSAFLLLIVASDFVVGNCFERLSRRDPERSWFLFFGWFKLVSLFMLVRIFFFANKSSGFQGGWIWDVGQERCWLGWRGLVGYGWKVIVEWDWFCCGWRWLIVLLLLRGGLFGVERVVVWGWEEGWLGLRDWFVGIERLVGWGWEVQKDESTLCASAAAAS